MTLSKGQCDLVREVLGENHPDVKLHCGDGKTVIKTTEKELEGFFGALIGYKEAENDQISKLADIFTDLARELKQVRERISRLETRKELEFFTPRFGKLFTKGWNISEDDQPYQADCEDDTIKPWTDAIRPSEVLNKGLMQGWYRVNGDGSLTPK